MQVNSQPKTIAAPAALFVTGAVSLAIFTLLTTTGGITGFTIPILNTWTTAAAAAIITAGIIELIRDDIVFGTLILVSGVLLTFGTGWGFAISNGAASTLFGAGLGPAATSLGLAMCGWVWLGIGLVQLLMLPVAYKVSWAMFFSQVVLGVAAILLAIGLVRRIGFGDGVVKIAGYIFLAYGVYAMYMATAFLTNAVYKRKLLPT